MSYAFTKSTMTGLFRCNNGAYYGKIKVEGRRYKKSFGKVSLEEARDAMAEWRRTIHWGGEEQKDRAGRVGECVEAVKARELGRPCSPSQMKFIENRFKFLQKQWPELAGEHCSAVTAADIVKWQAQIRKNGYSEATLRGTMLYLRMVFAYAEENNMCPENPMKDIKLPTLPLDGNSERHKITPEDLDRVLGEMRRMRPNGTKAADLAEETISV